MKKLFAIIIISALIIMPIFAKNIIAKTVISVGVKAITGLELDMKSLDIGVFKSLISIKGLKLFNPPGFFEDRLMIDMPEVYIDYDLKALLKGKVHLEELRLDLKEFIVVKNHKGKLNLDSLKTIRLKKPASEKPTRKKSKASNLQIDILKLKIGKVIYKDYYNRTRPRIREFKVNINERYENINDPRKFANLIVFKALVNTSVDSLADFDLGVLEHGLSDTLGAALKIVEGTVGTTLKAGEKITDTAKEATEKVRDAIKSILPFGK